MNTVKVRNITIGEGRPKICVPIVGKTREEILKEASTFSALPVDVAEWRVDWYDDVFDTEKFWPPLSSCMKLWARFLYSSLSEPPRKAEKKKSLRNSMHS